MDPNKKSPTNTEEKKSERIDLNDYNRKTEDQALKDHTARSPQTVDRNLNEQMGGNDNTVTSEPNQV